MTDALLLSTNCFTNTDELTPVINCRGRRLNIIHPGTDMAETVAGFIRRRFLLAFGAEPLLRIPQLLALTSAQWTLLAAVGVRSAGQERLFLEDYLPTAIEQLLPATAVPREKIAEIAHLAGVEPGVSRYLFASLSVWLKTAGYEWVVCTGTQQLRNSFQRMGIPTRVLADADPARLADRGAGWGNYYQHQPLVMAIRIADGISALDQAGLLRHVNLEPSAGDPSQQYGEHRYDRTA